MAVTIPFTGAVSLAEIEKHAQASFSARCKVFVYTDRVVIAQSSIKGAVILPKNEETGTNVVVAPQIPTALGRFIDKMEFPISVVGALALGFFGGAIAGIIGGSITYFVLLRLRHIPSLGIAKEVEDTVRRMDGAAPPPVMTPTKSKLPLLVILLGVALVPAGIGCLMNDPPDTPLGIAFLIGAPLLVLGGVYTLVGGRTRF